MVGHQLTTQGAGIQDHGPEFSQTGNLVTVYIPLGVVFETIPNTDLFAYFPTANTPVAQHPSSVWLLMYGGTASNDVMTGGSFTVKDLEPWAMGSSKPKEALQNNVKQAEKEGWHIKQTVNMQHDLTGYLGHNGWAKIPMGVPVNLVGADGNNIFKIDGVVSRSELLTNHPELKTGIDAASSGSRRNAPSATGS